MLDSDSVFGSYVEFKKIIHFNYDPDELISMSERSDELFFDLDVEISWNLDWESVENENLPYDWNFPDPPEFLQ